MKIALDANGNRVDAKVADKGQTYSCPVCGEKVVPKATISKVICPHFAHKAKSLCDEWKSDMSEWHYSWQEKFPLGCREVVLEKDGVKHRADVLIKDTVIEFQHSPISVEEFNARNQFYLGCGKHVIWIFDMTNKIKLTNESGFYFGHSNILKLSRIRHCFRDYSRMCGYSLFFQDGDNLFLILKEEFGEFTCFNPGVTLTQNAFLKDFGCCDRVDVESIGELIEKERKRQERIRAEQALLNEIGKRMVKTRETYIENSLINKRRSWKKRRL